MSAWTSATSTNAAGVRGRGLVASEWKEDLPGPTKRTYTVTPAGHAVLGAWLDSLGALRDGLDRISRERSNERRVTMCRKHRRRMRQRRTPNREDLLRSLEERQKDLEQEIADIHDLVRRLRDESGTAPTSEPALSI